MRAILWIVASRPIIGICTPLERARWRAWDDEVALLPRSYLGHVHRARGMAVLLTPDPEATENPDEMLALVYGLITAGGADIDPALYGAQPHTETRPSFPERDAFELALARRALERELPFLGICRGMQLLNAARGGTLRQHLPEELGHHEHRRSVGTFDEADDDVRPQPGSQAAGAAG